MNATRAAGLIFLGLTLGAGAALADTPGHAAACAAALTEAQSLQSDLGVWRAEARVLAAHRRDAGGLPEKFKPMADEHRKKEIVLGARMSAADQNRFTVHKDGACAEDAQSRRRCWPPRNSRTCRIRRAPRHCPRAIAATAPT